MLESVLSCGAGCTRGWSRVARVRVCRDRRGVTERGPPSGLPEAERRAAAPPLESEEPGWSAPAVRCGCASM